MESLFSLIGIAFILVYILPLIFSWRAYKEAKEIRNDLFDLKKDLLAQLKKLKTVGEAETGTVTETVTETVGVGVGETGTGTVTEAETETIGGTVTERVTERVTEIEEKTPPVEAQPETPKAPKVETPTEMYEPIRGFNWPSFNFNKTNLEQFIGEKLISIIGIAILVLGIFFTVKWAVDKNLISDATKVLIGFGAGAALIAVAHKLSQNFRAFSSILAGGAIAVFYFSVYQSFQAYHLLPQTAAFVAMIFITLLAVALALIYNKIELAMIALIGGFLTPFFVSTGEGNFKILFSYMLILNIGMVLVAYYKKWPILHMTAYALTLLIFGAWLMNEFDATKNHQKPALVFATLFHLTFLAAALVYNIRKQERFRAPEISLLLSNAMAYLAAGLYIYQHIEHGRWNGLFVLGMAVLYLGIALMLYRKQGLDKNLLYLLIALVCSFVSLAGPIQLEGNSITLFWAAEGVLLLYIAQKSQLSLLKQAGVLVSILCLISLGLDWKNNYYTVHPEPMRAVLNQAFLTGLVVASAYFVQIQLLKKETDTHWFWHRLPLNLWKNILYGITALVFFLTVYFEVGYQAWIASGVEEARTVMQGSCLFLFIGLALFYYFKKGNSLSTFLRLMLISLLLMYVYYQSNIQSLRHRALGEIMPSVFYHWHYLLPLSALFVCFILVRNLLQEKNTLSNHFKWMSWGLCFAIVYILSAESIHLWVYQAYEQGFSWSDSERKAIKTAWPIIWSLFSLVLMVSGMRRRIKLWRIISLSLFTLTIAKLFIYDISNVGQGGKIAAFIILGIILLLVSFLYQKIKGLFTDDDNNSASANV
ncbi:MAG: DUF2339 domain-containing protein [Chitinophagaceae bacterium]